MDEARINHYLQHVPIQMIELTDSLSSKSRSNWAVFAALLENKKMYFSQIRDEFNANPSEVDRALTSLAEGGLIFKRAKEFADVKNDNRTYYEPSLLGEMFYESMFDLVIPKKPNLKEITTPYNSYGTLPAQNTTLNITELSPVDHEKIEMVAGGSGNA